MASSRRSRVISSIANLSLASVGRAIAGATYRYSRERALAEIQAAVGARVASIESIAQKAYEQLGGTEVASFLDSQFTNQPAENLRVLAELYETHPVVKTCTSYIASALAGIPLRVHMAVGFEDGKEITESADDSPVGRMFRWINPQQSPSAFVEDLASWLILCGEAYVAFAAPGPMTPKGIPAEMYVLLSPFVEKVASPSNQIIGYVYNVGGHRAFFDSSEICYIKSFSPAGRFRGQGEHSAGIGTIATDQELRRFNHNVLKNGLHLSGILETDNEDLDAAQAEQIREKFMAQYSGSGKAAKTAVLWGGLKFNPQTILQKDVMMAEQVVQHRDEIIALFGLKPELLTEKFANKATAETVRRMAYEDVIIGRWGAKICSAFNATGLTRFDPNLRVAFDTREVPALQTSLSEKVTTAALAVSGSLMTVNEARAEFLGLAPIDGAEAEILLSNGMALGSVIAGATDQQPTESGKYLKADFIEVIGDRRPITGLERRLALEASRFGSAQTKASGDRFVWDRLRATSEARIERIFRAIYREIAQEVRNATTRSTIDPSVLAKIEQIFLVEGRTAAIRDFSPAVRKSIEDAVIAELAHLKIEGTFDIKPVRALARMAAQEQRIRNMMGKEWINLRADIMEGVQRGESQAKLVARTDTFFEGRRNNAVIIARTETTPAINCAAMDVAIGARQFGVAVVSIWRTAGDENVRRPPRAEFNHARAEGLTIIPGEEMFVIDGERLEYPGDSWNGASPGNTIGCRCGVENQVRDPRESDNRGERLR